MKGYTVPLGITKDGKYLAMASITPDDADILLKLVSQPRPDRINAAQNLTKTLKFLTSLPADKRSKARIGVSLRSTGGVQAAPTVKVDPKVARLYLAAVGADNEPGLDVLKSDLMRVMAGTALPGKPLLPFLSTEGFKKKVDD